MISSRWFFDAVLELWTVEFSLNRWRIIYECHLLILGRLLSHHMVSLSFINMDLLLHERILPQSGDILSLLIRLRHARDLLVQIELFILAVISTGSWSLLHNLWCLNIIGIKVILVLIGGLLTLMSKLRLSLGSRKLNIPMTWMRRMLIVLGRNHLVVVLDFIVIWHERLFIISQIVDTFHALINLWRDHNALLQLILCQLFSGLIIRNSFNIVTSINQLILESQGTVWIIGVREAFLELSAAGTLLLLWSIAWTFNVCQFFRTVVLIGALRVLLF